MAFSSNFVRPDWLGAMPFASYREYGSPISAVHRAWEAVPDRRQSLYDTHRDALLGWDKDLDQMRQFYINLTIERLKS